MFAPTEFVDMYDFVKFFTELINNTIYRMGINRLSTRSNNPTTVRIF